MSGRQVVSIRLFEESPEYVIAVGVKQEQQEESHAHVLGCHEYVFGYFASGDHFPQQEHDVTAVEPRYRDYVHEGECYREECGYLPERKPVPAVRKHISDCSATATASPSL